MEKVKPIFAILKLQSGLAGVLKEKTAYLILQSSSFLENLKLGTHPIVMSCVGKEEVWNMELTEPRQDAAVLTGS